jgi:tripartite-type tricarboxylate transporter receptor subunit TctC
MKLPRRRFLHLAAGAAALPAMSRIARAQTYPSRQVRLIVPFPAGGSTDAGARIIGEYLSRVFGRQFYVENRSGAGGNIGIEAAAKSQADGYTLACLHRSCRELSPRLQAEYRSLEGPGSGHPIVAPASGSRRASVARREFGV